MEFIRDGPTGVVQRPRIMERIRESDNVENRTRILFWRLASHTDGSNNTGEPRQSINRGCVEKTIMWKRDKMVQNGVEAAR